MYIFYSDINKFVQTVQNVHFLIKTSTVLKPQSQNKFYHQYLEVNLKDSLDKN